ncbi:uncharacterized protein L969DRAFT_52531 [Mixia osmundae IAM 14324]|uniref:uncharacterized protein n=1 Tax=Mixia osmundae (strain CBS 9802 / IAM 14324 / JCM 22182 / KY 12970) TaxID=764103 RepID=UPI0004A5587B|nr:uncharacterized protein L969DRAFT_52531 [Mixia osmundae IAM 14324]KEI37569.1 hypothetical protein L969DRAFT_52531 [Mixia osmundae IAM 14324]
MTNQDVLLFVGQPSALAELVLAPPHAGPHWLQRRLLILLIGCAGLLWLSSSIARDEPATRSLTDAALDYAPGPLSQTAVQEANEKQLVERITRTHSAYEPADFVEETDDESLKVDVEDVFDSVYRTRPIGVTAIILAWKRRRGLQLVVQHLSRYPFIREIIVWNNNALVHLSRDNFNLLPPYNETVLLHPKLRIVNSPSNLHDFAKHLACSLASYETCYFNDDDWLNPYLDALYTKYIDQGGEGARRIVGNTLPWIAWEHRRWRFENPEIDMTAGFIWLGTGSLAPRQLSQRFVDQMGTRPIQMDRDSVLLADMYFGLWTNTYPEQMSNPLEPIDVEGGEVGWSRGSEVDQWTVVYANILDALRKLYTVLRKQGPLTIPYPFALTNRMPEHDARSPCKSDRCLFITSFSPFPSPNLIRYPVKAQAEPAGEWTDRFRKRVADSASSIPSSAFFDPHQISHIHEHEERFSTLHATNDSANPLWPTVDYWISQGSWHLAVDGDPSTCWTSSRPPIEGDYIGLLLVKPTNISAIKLIASDNLAQVTARAGSAWRLQTQSDLGLAYDERELLDVSTAPLADSEGRSNLTLTLAASHDAETDIARKIRLVARTSFDKPITVCSMDINGTQE